mmetsp:Transcript_10580/g.38895  ORF Transcript_10580/g.38895 Transcript_10580/m.38895 type:complete len:232 (+) Transcript_10580:1435-2130(+)
MTSTTRMHEHSQSDRRPRERSTLPTKSLRTSSKSTVIRELRTPTLFASKKAMGLLRMIEWSCIRSVAIRSSPMASTERTYIHVKKGSVMKEIICRKINCLKLKPPMRELSARSTSKKQPDSTGCSKQMVVASSRHTTATTTRRQRARSTVTSALVTFNCSPSTSFAARAALGGTLDGGAGAWSEAPGASPTLRREVEGDSEVATVTPLACAAAPSEKARAGPRRRGRGGCC